VINEKIIKWCEGEGFLMAVAPTPAHLGFKRNPKGFTKHSVRLTELIKNSFSSDSTIHEKLLQNPCM